MTLTSYLKLSCVGDVMIFGPALESLKRIGVEAARDTVCSPLSGSDIIIANLEGPITDRLPARDSKRKMDRIVLALFDERFVLSLANNHIMDFGEEGLRETIQVLAGHKLHYAGAGLSLEEARRPALINAKGIKFGVICAADPRFQAATKKSAGTFPARPALLRESIRELQHQVQIIVVSIHAGTEFITTPSPYQAQLAELCLEEGAQVVQFHHAHCISGILQDRRGVVFFGTGNYLFPYAPPRGFKLWYQSATWQVSFAAPTWKIAEVNTQPLILGNDGLPRKAKGRDAQRIRTSIELRSDWVRNNKRWRLWRLREMLHPRYLWVNAIRYFDHTKRQGLRASIDTLMSSAKAQLFKYPE